MNVEAVGEAMTGGLVARSVEPRAGELTADGHTHESACLNCRTPLIGSYCHACGQAAHVHRTLGAFFHDLMHGVLHFEGKIFRTLPLLAWRPGELTRRYIDGERARFVSPIALFLFSVFLMFAVFSWTGNFLNSAPGTDGPSFETQLDADIAELRGDIATLERTRASNTAAGRSTVGVDRELEEKRARASLLQEMRANGVTTATISRASDDMTDAPGWMRRAYLKAKENPSLLFYKLQANGYKFSWALIPISVPLVWLLFLHRRRYRAAYRVYDHVVFVTYSIAFMSIALIVLALISVPVHALRWDDGLIALAAVIIPPVHMYRQLRGAYGLSRFSAAWRTWALLWFAAAALSLFGLLLVLMGVLG